MISAASSSRSARTADRSASRGTRATTFASNSRPPAIGASLVSLEKSSMLIR